MPAFKRAHWVHHPKTIFQKPWFTASSELIALPLNPNTEAQPVDAGHRLFRAASDFKDNRGHVLITAYAVLRPDQQWSLMIINEDYDNTHTVAITFEDAEGETRRFFVEPVARITFGKEQYRWHSAMADGYDEPDGPADQSTLPLGTGRYLLPPVSMTVFRGHISTQ